MSDRQAVQLKNTKLVNDGTEYTFMYVWQGGEFQFTGIFTGWDALKDEFAFEEAATGHDPVTLVVAGSSVLNICSIEPQPINPVAEWEAGLNLTTEVDPSGLNAHQPGAKLDAGKVYADSILAGFPRSLWGVAEVGTFGANKYSLGGWQTVEDGIRRYRDAAGRHRLKRQKGELTDPDSNLPHEYHEAWNVLAALELELREQEK